MFQDLDGRMVQCLDHSMVRWTRCTKGCQRVEVRFSPYIFFNRIKGEGVGVPLGQLPGGVTPFILIPYSVGSGRLAGGLGNGRRWPKLFDIVNRATFREGGVSVSRRQMTRLMTRARELSH